MGHESSGVPKIPDKWSLRRIGDFAVVKGGKRLPAGTALTDKRTNHPYIRIVDFRDGRIDKSSLMFVPENVFPRISRYTISTADVWISIVGTVGLVGVLDEDLDGANLTENAAKICNIQNGVDKIYLSFVLRSQLGQEQIAARTVGSTQPKLALFRIEDIQVPLPPLPEQRAIAHILGTLDDKIELNRQRNQTLEAMARALFQDWFIDFGPVRAKMEGREAYLPSDLWSLFPGRLDQAGKPEGWQIKKISDLCDAIYSGGTPSTKNPEYWGGEIPWLSSGETRSNFVIDTERKITEAGVSNSSTRLAPAMSTVIASAGQGNTRGQTSLLAINSYVNQSVVVLTAKKQTSSPFHLFFDLKKRYEEFRRISDAHSSRGSLTTKLIGGLDIILPRHEIIREFDLAAGNQVIKIIKNLYETRILDQLRDSLLPKLISGELRIQDAERFIKERAL